MYISAPPSNGSPITRFILEQLAVDLDPATVAKDSVVQYERWALVDLPPNIANGKAFVEVAPLPLPADLLATASMDDNLSRMSRFTGDGRDDEDAPLETLSVLAGFSPAKPWSPEVHFKGRRYASIRVSGLLPTTRHSFRLTAVNRVGTSLQSPPSDPVAVLADVPEVPEITFVHVIPASMILVEWRVLRDNGAAITKFDVQFQHSRYIGPTVTTEATWTFSEWMDGGTALEPSSLSMIPEQLDNVPRAWPADSVSRWAHVVRGMNPLEMSCLRVRAWNVMGCSAWSAPSVRMRTTGRAWVVCMGRGEGAMRHLMCVCVCFVLQRCPPHPSLFPASSATPTLS